MDEKFDQLARGVAQYVTRQQGLKRVVLGLVGITLVFFLPSKAASRCLDSGSPCGKPGQHGCGNCCSKSFFCEISADTGRQCFCN
jgi:hypothetical protein